MSKAIDKAAGAERESVGVDPERAARLVNQGGEYETASGWSAGSRSALVTEPVTEDAHRWQGWGTALKPAHEPIVVARKPLGGSIDVVAEVERQLREKGIDEEIRWTKRPA